MVVITFAAENVIFAFLGSETLGDATALKNVCSRAWSNSPTSRLLSQWNLKTSPSCSYRDTNYCCTYSRVFLRSSVDKCGIHRSYTFEYWRCCLVIVFTLPSLMFSIPDNSPTVIRLFPPNECIDAVTVIACYVSPRPALIAATISTSNDEDLTLRHFK